MVWTETCPGENGTKASRARAASPPRQCGPNFPLQARCLRIMLIKNGSGLIGWGYRCVRFGPIVGLGAVPRAFLDGWRDVLFFQKLRMARLKIGVLDNGGCDKNQNRIPVVGFAIAAE